MSRSVTLSTRMAIRSLTQFSLEPVLTALLITVGWANAFSEMWLRWFPAWHDTSLSLFARFTESDSYYAHGPLVPLVSLSLAFGIYKRRGIPAEFSRSGSVAGWSILIFALLLHLLSAYARVTFVSGFALVGVIAGLLLLWGGRRLLRTYAIPLVLIVFMVPLPMNWIAELNFNLKLLAGRAAVWLSGELFRVPAVMDGSFIFLSPDASGELKQLILENVCSGLRSLIALTWFGALFAAICHVRTHWRIVFLILTVPLAIGCNVLRITSLILVAHFFGTQAAGAGSWFHNLAGLFVFFLAMGILFGLEKLILKFDRPIPNDDADEPRECAAVRNHPAAVVLLLLTAGLSVHWAGFDAPACDGTRARQAAPMTFQIHDVTFDGRDVPLDKTTMAILETRDILYRQYLAPAGSDEIDLLIVYSSDNRKGTHPPEVCLAGKGQSIVLRRDCELTLGDGRSVPMRELVSRENAAMKYHLYVYKCGERYTSSFFRQQANIFLNGLLRHEVSGTLVRVSVPVKGDEVESARQLAMTAAETILPEGDRRLP